MYCSWLSWPGSTGWLHRFFQVGPYRRQALQHFRGYQAAFGQPGKGCHRECVPLRRFSGRLRKARKRNPRDFGEFKTYSNGHLTVNYSDPSDATSEEQRQKQYVSLIGRGLTPTNVFANEDGKRTEKIIFPGVIVAVRYTLGTRSVAER